MTSTSQYLLPGESDGQSSSVVVHHGKRISSPILRIYEPKENDFVIGIVIVRTADCLLVDINSSEPAILSIHSFDSGRIPSRQQMNRFSAICARVVNADSWSQTELSCQTNSLGKKSNFGLLREGFLFRYSLNLCQKLSHSSLIRQLDQTAYFRLARNGFLWYKTDSINSMIAIRNVLQKYEFENNIEQLIEYYQKLLNQLDKY